MPGRFKDYIAIPRINGYQSCTRPCSAPKDCRWKCRFAQSKWTASPSLALPRTGNTKPRDKSSATPQRRAREWLAHLVEIQESGSSEEFLESVKVDLFPDKIYVFTPKGDIMPLPKGATTVDFAYAVHTGVGNRCVAAKDRSPSRAACTQLQNGQTVEIITSRGAKPNPHWVTFVVTAKGPLGHSSVHEEYALERIGRSGQAAARSFFEGSRFIASQSRQGPYARGPRRTRTQGHAPNYSNNWGWGAAGAVDCALPGWRQRGRR